MPCCLWWNGMPKKCFRVEKLPARVKREIGLFAANSIFVSSHNCYSANAHPIGKKINLLWANNRVICKLNIWKECHPQDRFLRSFHSAQDLCRTVLRICAAQCKGFELCSAKDLLLHLIPYFSGFQRWQFQQWEAIWGGKNEKVKPIIVINIMKNTYIWGGENKVKPIVINIMKNA